MQTRSIQILPDHLYHVYNRGNSRELIFRTDENYRFFLMKLRRYLSKGGVDLLAFCLMPNHFHLVVNTGKNIGFSNIMRSFSTSYVKSFHQYHETTGHLYEGDYKAKEIPDDAAIATLIPYVHLNPWKAGLTKRPEDWLYSDCHSWCYDLNSDNLPSLGFRDEIFGNAGEYHMYLEQWMALKEEDL